MIVWLVDLGASPGSASGLAAAGGSAQQAYTKQGKYDSSEVDKCFHSDGIYWLFNCVFDSVNLYLLCQNPNKY